MYSCVLYSGLQSDWFPILQGTKQGGVWSPFLYLLYINSLIVQLKDSNLGLKIQDRDFCSPSFADDMTLLALSSKSLQSMMNICYRYACQWRYQYNAHKSVIVTFNESKQSFKKRPHNWSMGQLKIMEKEEYSHLGIVCNKYNKNSYDVKCLDGKLRGTFFGLIKDGIHRNGLNPLTSYRIYKSIVLPRALFGSEMLNPLSENDLLVLERTHRLCLKHVQGLHLRSRTDIVLGMLSAFPIEAEIDKRKLLFLGQLCRLEGNCAVKQLFVLRLCAFVNGLSFTGFLPDVVNLLHKYNLYYVLQSYLNTGVFPSKFDWKRSIASKVSNHFIHEWNVRTSSYQFSIYREIQTEFSFCPIWHFARRNPLMLHACFASAQLVAHLSYFDVNCRRCGQSNIRISLTQHILTRCPLVYGCRRIFYDEISNICNQSIAEFLRSLTDEQYVRALFGLNQAFNARLTSSHFMDIFYLSVLRFLDRVWCCYKQPF